MAYWQQINDHKWRYWKDEETYLRATGQAKVETHSVIQDSMDPTWHPATGEMIDSKRKFRERTKAAGCVELDGINLNPGPKPIQVERQDEIGRQIWEEMDRRKVDYKDIQREIREVLRGERR